MTHHMKLIVQNSCLGSIPLSRVQEGLPHVHNRQSNLAALLFAQRLEEKVHTLLTTISTPKPNRPLSQKITDHNPVLMALTDRDFVNPNHLRPRLSRSLQLLLHVLLFQSLHRLPVQVQFPGYIRNRRVPTPTAHIKAKSLGVKRIVRQPVQSLLLHALAPSAVDPSNLQLQVNAHIPAGQIPDPSGLAVVERMMNKAAHSTCRFLPLRKSRMTRALGSPKTPLTVCCGRKPGNRYVSQSRRYRTMENQYHFWKTFPTYEPLVHKGFSAYFMTILAHSIGRRSFNNNKALASNRIIA